MSIQRSLTIDALLDEHGAPCGDRSSQRPCQGARFHSPTPLTTNEIELPTGRVVSLCPTCKANLAAYIHLAHHAPAQFTWPVLREFGNIVRALGQESMGALMMKHGAPADAAAT